MRKLWLCVLALAAAIAIPFLLEPHVIYASGR